MAGCAEGDALPLNGWVRMIGIVRVGQLGYVSQKTGRCRLSGSFMYLHVLLP
jgi:hypothetical protein